MALLGQKQLAFRAHFQGQKIFFSEMVTEKRNFFRGLRHNHSQSQHTKSELISYPCLFTELDYHHQRLRNAVCNRRDGAKNPVDRQIDTMSLKFILNCPLANVYMYENQTKIFHFAKYEFIQLSTVKTSFLPFFHHSDTSGFSVLKKVVFTVFQSIKSYLAKRKIVFFHCDTCRHLQGAILRTLTYLFL